MAHDLIHQSKVYVELEVPTIEPHTHIVWLEVYEDQFLTLENFLGEHM